MSFQHALILTCFLGVSSCVECFAGEGTRLSCAQGAVLAALTANDIDVDAKAVVDAFPEEHQPSDSATPMSVVCEVINSFGFTATSVRFDISKANRNWESCILLFDADPDDPGHFVWLKSIEGDQAILVDPRDVIGEHVLSLEQLAAYWQGHAITVESRGVHSLSWYITPFLVAAILVLLIGESKYWLGNPTASILLFFSITSVGCSREQSRLPSDIAFQDRLISVAGLREGMSRQIELPLTISKDFVEISSIKTSCSCATVGSDFTGKRLSVGETHDVLVTIDPGSQKEVAFDVVVVTKDGAASRVNVVGVVEQVPRAATPKVVREYTINTTPKLRGKLRIVRSKPKGTAALTPQAKFIESRSITLIHDETVEIFLPQSRSGQEVVNEQSEWSWEAASVNGKFSDVDVVIPLGEHDIPISFKFDGVPPLRGLPASIYCGKLSPAEEWRRRYELTIPARSARHVISSKASASNISCEIGDILPGEPQVIFVSLTAPRDNGKFSEFIELSFSDIVEPFKVEILGEVLPSE